MKTIYVLFPVIFSGLIFGCNSTSEVILRDVPDTDPYYTSAFPVTDVSSNLENIQKSIVRIASTGQYIVYWLENTDVTIDQLEDLDLESASFRQNSMEESTAGTAIIIGKSQNRAYLLTSAHTVNFPERIISYRHGENIPDDTYIESVAIKQDQENLVLTQAGLASYNTIDKDADKDLALLDVNLQDLPGENLRPLRIDFGSSEYLRTGSFVYVLGYPRGYPVATRGIVIQPIRVPGGNFLTDVLFNRGISGGLIIASKNNYRSFEWVGIARSGVATQDYYLVPDLDKINFDKELQDYDGVLQVKGVTRLNYGLAHTISTQAISEFLRQHRNRLRRLNRSLDSAFD